MIHKIKIIKNIQGEFNENSDIIFMNKFDTDYLLDNDGITIGDTKTRQSTYNAYSIPGVIMENITYTTGKNISIVGWIVDNPSGSMTLKKKNIERFFNPLEKFRLEFGDRYIDGYPKTTIKYGEKYKDNNDTFCKFMIEFFCPYPFFKSKESLRFYPFVEPAGDRTSQYIDNYPINEDGTVGLQGISIPFKAKLSGETNQAYDIAIINNPSDCNIGFRLVIDVDGTNVPTTQSAGYGGIVVTNLTINKYFSISQSGEVLDGQYILDTNPNNKIFVDQNGDSTLDGFDPGGSFFQLVPGDNIIKIRYPAKNGYIPSQYMHVSKLYFELYPEYFYVKDEEE